MIDISLVPSALGAIKAAKDIASAALAMRDWNALSSELARMNEQLLRAQEALFGHNAQLLSMQQELFEKTERLRKLEEALSERGKYELHQVALGKWVYRSALAGSDSSGNRHFLCQPCFDNGRKAVLQYTDSESFGKSLDCPVCRTSTYVGPGYNADEA